MADQQKVSVNPPHPEETSPASSDGVVPASSGPNQQAVCVAGMVVAKSGGTPAQRGSLTPSVAGLAQAIVALETSGSPTAGRTVGTPLYGTLEHLEQQGSLATGF